MEHEIGIWDSVLLENLTEDYFISNIHERYKKDHIHTYIGTSVVAVNPYRHISENSLDIIRTYGFKGLFQLPPHVYGLANLAYQTLRDQNEDQCIILTGESGSGKTESFKMIVNFLTRIQDNCSLSKLNTVKSVTNIGVSSDISQRISSTNSPTYSASKVVANSSTIMCQISSSPYPYSKCDSSSKLRPMRTESSDGDAKRNIREKNVDFDLLHHKSFDYIADSETKSTACSYAKSSSSKSCFKNQRPQLHCPVPTKFVFSSTPGIGGCHQCGHSRCSNRLQSRRQSPLLTIRPQRGNCLTMELGQASEMRADSASCADSIQRLSLYEMHRMDKNPCKKSLERAKYNRTLSQKLRECITCADVFLEAMGNAATIHNNNSSRYGKLFDIVIDFKGDPIGVHITHSKDYSP